MNEKQLAAHRRLSGMLPGILPRLRRQARRYCHDNDDAEDLVQDTLQRILRSGRMVRGEEIELPYIMAVLGNAAKAMWAERKRKGGTSQELDERYERPPVWAPVPQDDAVFLKEVLLHIYRLPNDRKAPLLCAAEGIDIEEMAKLYEVSPADAGDMLWRARKRLKEWTGV